jgi:hypothetical protein
MVEDLKSLPYFTVGVIVSCSKLVISKSGKEFAVLKLSDLNKYNSFLVKKLVEKECKGDADSVKMALSTFDSCGYKQMKLMAFGDCAMAVAA